MSWWLLPFYSALVFLLGRVSCRLPELLLRWHRRAYRIWWRYKSRHRGGRPRIDQQLIDLIRRMSAENPMWGAPRIHGELRRLGYQVAQSTISKYMIPHGSSPTQGWLTFLRNHADAIASIDMLTVPTIKLDRLYAFVVLGHGRRRILHVEVTARPRALWLAHQITEAFPWDEAPSYLVRDNDGAYGFEFRRRVKVMGIRDRPTMPRSPWQNGFVERLIGSIKRECLDHLIIIDANHLRRVLKTYVNYYNEDRTHLALDKDSPLGRPIESTGELISQPILGGLHHRYRRK